MRQLELGDEPLLSLDIFTEIYPSVVRQFGKYHRENPHVYGLYKQFALQAKNSGRKRFGSMLIINRMRWYAAFESKSDDGFKISHNFSSCYARLLMLEDVFFESLFDRQITNKNHPEYGKKSQRKRPDNNLLNAQDNRGSE